MIELDAVTVRYPNGSTALTDVSAALPEGSFHFLTGRSGAGKSTFLRLLYAAVKPTSGRLTLLGRDAQRLSRHDVAHLRRRIGVVFQDFALLDHLTVYENVALPLAAVGHGPARYRDNVLEMLEWVNLSDSLRRRPPELSGGEKQRVAIARAMVSVPDLILADEPTGSVDAEMGERILALLVEMNRLGRTVVVATHDPRLAASLGAPTLALEGGRLVSPGAAAA